MRYFYSSQLLREIDFSIENFYKLNVDQLKNLVILHEDTIRKIISNDKLSLNTEDQLQNFINELCSSNKKNFYKLYEYVCYENISNEKIESFINDFDCESITKDIWKSLSKRFLNKQNYDRIKQYKVKEIPFPDKSNDLKGIFSYFRSHLNIKD